MKAKIDYNFQTKSWRLRDPLEIVTHNHKLKVKNLLTRKETEFIKEEVAKSVQTPSNLV